MRIVFDVPDALPPGEKSNIVKHLIEGAARGWVAPFRRIGLPRLYDSGIKFQFEPGHGSGNEDFASPLVAYLRKWADCDDMGIYRLCEIMAYDLPFDVLQERKPGQEPTCNVTWVGNAIHVRIRHPNGKVEDPAVNLGAPT